VLEYLNSLDKKIVYILWGNEAIKKGKVLNNPNQLVISSVHPSPLSAYRGFFGSKPFSKSCDYLNIDYNIWKKEL
jgi:uracil-DNA glycosylase